jgi:hypothetical protein
VPLLLDSATTAPPDGVNPVNCRVADVRTVPVWAVVVAVRVSPLYVAETPEVAVVATGRLDTPVPVLLAPAATVRLAATVAAAGLLLESVTTAPPVGAAALSVTVAVAVVPPGTLVGLRPTAASCWCPSARRPR